MYFEVLRTVYFSKYMYRLTCYIHPTHPHSPTNVKILYAKRAQLICSLPPRSRFGWMFSLRPCVGRFDGMMHSCNQLHFQQNPSLKQHIRTHMGEKLCARSVPTTMCERFALKRHKLTRVRKSLRARAVQRRATRPISKSTPAPTRTRCQLRVSYVPLR